MSIDWGKLDGDITRLYVNEDKSADETIQYLQTKHNVKITPRQFKRRYTGLKKLRADEWRAIIKEIRRRSANGLKSEVFLNSRKLDPNRVERERRRYSGPRAEQVADGNIRIGIDTRGEHRIEIRTPASIPRELSLGPERCFRPVSRQSVGFVSEEMFLDFDLQHADLSTPQLGSPSLQLPCSPNQSVFGNATLQENLHGFLSPVAFLDTNLPSFSDCQSVVVCNSGEQAQPGLFNRYSNLFGSSPSLPPQRHNFLASTSFGVSGVTQAVNDLGSSTPLLATLDILQQSIQKGKRYPWSQSLSRPQGWALSYLRSVEPNSNIPAPIILLLEDILDNPVRVSFRNPQTQTMITSHTKQILHVFFSVFTHLCSNSLLPREGLISFLKWLREMDLTNQFVAYLKKGQTAILAFFGQVLHLPYVDLPYYVDALGGIDWQMTEILQDEGIALPKRLAERLLRRFIEYGFLNAAKAVFTRLNSMDAEWHGRRNAGFLCIAVKCGRRAMAAYFINQGCNINEECRCTLYKVSNGETDGETLLHNALTLELQKWNSEQKSWHSENNDFELLDLLLSKGAALPPDFDVEDHLEPEFWGRDRIRGDKYPHARQFCMEKRPLIYTVIDAAEAGNKDLSDLLNEHGAVQENALDYVLSQAVARGNLSAVRTLLQRKVNPDATQQQIGYEIFGKGERLKETSPIQIAASRRYHRIFCLLLRAGANMNEQDAKVICRAWTARDQDELRRFTLPTVMTLSERPTAPLIGAFALTLAAKQTDLAACGALLDRGVAINDYGWDGLNALQHAAMGDAELVQFLLDEGADVNFPACPDGGRTALQAAARHANDRTLDLLLQAGADIKAPTAERNGLTVLESIFKITHLIHRREEGNWAYARFKRLLCLGAAVNNPSVTDNKILFFLIDVLRPDCLELALKAGARVEDTCRLYSRVKTPLQYAALKGNMDAVLTLLEHGADINAEAKGDYGRTALQSATSSEYVNLEMVEFLLSKGADVNAPPAIKGGITALQGAASHRDLRAARLLLDHGANVNAPAAEEEGRTALEVAAEWGRLDMVQLLLGNGAVGDPAKGHSRAIELAEEGGKHVVAEFLRQYGDFGSVDMNPEGMGQPSSFQFQSFVFPDVQPGDSIL